MTKTATGQLGVDLKTGEVTCSDCLSLQGELKEARAALAAKADELKGAERDLNTWRRRYSDLARDKEAEAREHELFDTIADLFDFWRWAAGLAEDRDGPTGHRFSADRFWLAYPFYKREGLWLCRRAIIGRTFDHFEAPRRNGTTEHFHEWERIFGDKGKGATPRSNFEASCNNAPKKGKPATEVGWRARAEAIIERMEGEK